ncbi:MAG: carbohydrate kinase [Lachnospiraceae bacterium]|nr:carbohydrate kinase [Lachnospiraceae bacterium]
MDKEIYDNSSKEFDVIALGELLIDFTQSGISAQGNGLFEACPGGAPCNVLSMLQRLNKKTAFIGKVGRDSFGSLLKQALLQQGIDASQLFFDESIPTTLAFVHTMPDGDRDFSFYRKPGADMMLREEEVEEAFIAKARLFHFGTLSMTHQEIRRATKKAVRLAKKNGLLISFDPNLRPPLWDTMQNARAQMEYGLGMCDILKIADNELCFLTGKEDYDEGIACLQRAYRIPLILLTMGKDGSRAYYKGSCIKADGFSCHTIETTGAGDTFFACVISYVLEHGLYDLTEPELKEMLTFANAAAALVTTRKGALRAMPQREEVERWIEEYQG